MLMSVYIIMTKKNSLEQKKEKPTVKELEALVAACPSIKPQLAKKIKREKEVKTKNIETIFNKNKKR
jgi:hypothetical protein